MASTLLTFFEQLADKAGIKANDPELIELLKNPAFTTTLPETLDSVLNKNLISLADARDNHPAIKAHYFAQFSHNLEKSWDKSISDLNLEDDDVLQELNSDRMVTAKFHNLGGRLKAYMDAKTKNPDKKSPKEVESLNLTINELNEKLRIEKEGRKADNDKSSGEMKTFRTELALNGKTSGLKTIYDTLPSDVRSISIKNILNKELQDSNADFVLDENGNLKLQKKDGSNYFDENNRQLTADDFVSKILAKNKILVQSAPNSEQTGVTPQSNGQPATVNSNGKSKINVDSLMQESLKGLEASPTVMI